MTDIDAIENPSLYEVNQMKYDWGLQGEDDTHMVVLLSFIKGGTVIMTGLSSGGKDANVNAAEYCVPDDWVFQVPTSLSKTVLYEKAEQMNSCPVHRHKDITSIEGKSWLEDIWKRHGDGNPISHSWTEVVPERHEVTKTIQPPNCMVLFLASDNEQTDLNDYAEVRNRALVVGIDDSADLTERVNERQANQEAGRIERLVSEERTQEIRDYVGSIPMHTYGDGGSGGMLNPVAVAIDEQNPLPQHFTEARRDFPRLMDFMKSVTLFHYDDRLEVPKKALTEQTARGMVTMLVTPADAWLAMRVFGEKMVLSALNLTDKDFELLEILRGRQNEALTADELQMEMRSRGYNITTPDVRRSMDNMQYKGYIRPNKDGSRVSYTAAEFANKARRYVDLDWAQVVETTRETAEETLPSPIDQQYIERFCEGDGLIVTHPFTGEAVNLTEQTANKLQEKEEELAEKMDDEVFDSDEGGDSDDDGLDSWT